MWILHILVQLSVQSCSVLWWNHTNISSSQWLQQPSLTLQSSSEFIFFVPAELRLATVSVLVSLISPHPCPSSGLLPSPIPRGQLPPHTHKYTHTPPPVCPPTNRASPCLPLPLLFGRRLFMWCHWGEVQPFFLSVYVCVWCASVWVSERGCACVWV